VILGFIGSESETGVATVASGSLMIQTGRFFRRLRWSTRIFLN